MLLGWRPHDLDRHYLPFGHGIGIQVATSDPEFMKRHGAQLRPDERPAFPYDPVKVDKLISEGDELAVLNMNLGRSWLSEGNSGK